MTNRPINFPRRGLNETEAAVYVGVGVTLFREMVADRRMPKPRAINARRVWDMIMLDAAIDALPVEGEAPANDTWGDLGAANGNFKAQKYR